MFRQSNGNSVSIHKPIMFLLLMLIFFHQSGCDTRGTIAVDEGMIAVNNIELYYQTLGKGDPIIIVHGGPGLSHSYLLPQMAELADKYKLIFYDQRASGSSTGVVDSTTMTIDQFVDDLEGVRQYFKLEKLNLMGHSWGGLVAMNYAIKYPDHLKTLMLISSLGGNAESMAAMGAALAQRLTSEIDTATKKLMSSEAFIKSRPQAMEEFARLTFSSYFYNAALCDSLTLTFNTVSAQNMLPIYSAFMPYLVTYDIIEKLVSVTCPTLIIHGDYDPLPIQFATDLQKYILYSDFIVLEQCGHFPFIEVPGPFFTIIRDFLETPFE